nr:acyl-CoA thioesterase domain-containing protein [Brachybacterium sp. Z12]
MAQARRHQRLAAVRPALPSANGGRGLTHGQLFDRGGDLVATVTQEGMIRVKQQG